MMHVYGQGWHIRMQMVRLKLQVGRAPNETRAFMSQSFPSWVAVVA